MDTLRDLMLVVKVLDQILDSCIISCRILSDFHVSLIPMELYLNSRQQPRDAFDHRRCVRTDRQQRQKHRVD